MLDPQRVDGPEENEPLDHRPVGLADLRLLGGELAVGEIEQVLEDAVAAAELPEIVLARARIVEAHRPERHNQRFHAPVVGIVGGEVRLDEGADLVIEERLDRLGQVVGCAGGAVGIEPFIAGPFD